MKSMQKEDGGVEDKILINISRIALGSTVTWTRVARNTSAETKQTESEEMKIKFNIKVGCLHAPGAKLHKKLNIYS